MSRFYTKGLLTPESIDEYLNLQIEQDAKIKKIIEATGRARAVTQSDRDYYQTWSVAWGFDDDMILYAAKQAVGKTYPTPYVNQLLSAYKAKGISTVEQAKRTPAIVPATATRTSDHTERVYTPEELHSIVRSIGSLSDADL